MVLAQLDLSRRTLMSESEHDVLRLDDLVEIGPLEKIDGRCYYLTPAPELTLRIIHRHALLLRQCIEVESDPQSYS